VGALQDRLQTLGLDWVVFEEDSILISTLKQRLSGKLRKASTIWTITESDKSRTLALVD